MLRIVFLNWTHENGWIKNGIFDTEIDMYINVCVCVCV